MIYRKRNISPAELNDRSDDWISRLAVNPELDYKREWRRFVNSTHVNTTRDALVEMYNRKCCFCEHNTSGHAIEHFVPKSINPQRLFDYNNLHLICAECNSYKGNKVIDNVVDPSIEDPGQHITFQAQKIKSISVKGNVTIDVARLDRKGLDDLRATFLKNVKGQIDIIIDYLENEPDVDLVNKYLKSLQKIKEDNLGSNSPFSKMLCVNLMEKIDDLEQILNELIIQHNVR